MDPITIGILVILAVIVLVYLFYKRILHFAFVLLNLAFISSIAGVLAALFFPVIFTSTAEVIFSESEFVDNLATVDKTLTSIKNAPGDIQDSIIDFFNGGNDESELKTDQELGLYNDFIALMSTILRWGTFLFSFIALIFAIYIRYAFGGIREAQQLEKRVKKLEQQLGISPHSNKSNQEFVPPLQPA